MREYSAGQLPGQGSQRERLNRGERIQPNPRTPGWQQPPPPPADGVRGPPTPLAVTPLRSPRGSLRVRVPIITPLPSPRSPCPPAATLGHAPHPTPQGGGDAGPTSDTSHAVEVHRATHVWPASAPTPRCRARVRHMPYTAAVPVLEASPFLAMMDSQPPHHTHDALRAEGMTVLAARHVSVRVTRAAAWSRTPRSEIGRPEMARDRWSQNTSLEPDGTAEYIR